MLRHRRELALGQKCFPYTCTDVSTNAIQPCRPGKATSLLLGIRRRQSSDDDPAGQEAPTAQVAAQARRDVVCTNGDVGHRALLMPRNGNVGSEGLLLPAATLLPVRLSVKRIGDFKPKRVKLPALDFRC